MNKNPGLWIVVLIAVVGWNLYDIFGPHDEAPSQTLVIMHWILMAGAAAGLVGAIAQFFKQHNPSA